VLMQSEGIKQYVNIVKLGQTRALPVETFQTPAGCSRLYTQAPGAHIVSMG
jgi:hypothetical protein